MIALCQEQIEANKQIAGASKGMLAPVTGKGKVLTLGCGHFGQFNKAANAGCKTHLEGIADAHGVIDISKIKRKDARYRGCLEGGWEWEILPEAVEIAWPKSPGMIQRALNASNEIAAGSTELEVGVTMGTVMESGSSPDVAIGVAKAANPACADYLKELCDLVKRYGGGKGSARLANADAFAKKFGVNLKLGVEFISAVSNLKFPNSREFPYVVEALLCVNLTSKKVVDGFGRTLTKSDVSSLSSARRFNDVQQA